MAKKAAKTRKTTRVRVLAPRTATSVKGGKRSEAVHLSEVVVTKLTDST